MGRHPSCGLSAPPGAVSPPARYGPFVADEDVIKQAGEMLAAAARPPARVILFGSHARGEAGPTSDLDLLVIQRDLPSRRDERIRLRKALRGLGVPVDLIVMSERHAEEWGGVQGTMLKAALDEGRILAET